MKIFRPLRGHFARPPAPQAGLCVRKNYRLCYDFLQVNSVSGPYLVRIILICTFADVGARPDRKA